MTKLQTYFCKNKKNICIFVPSLKFLNIFVQILKYICSNSTQTQTQVMRACCVNFFCPNCKNTFVQIEFLKNCPNLKVWIWRRCTQERGAPPDQQSIAAGASVGVWSDHSGHSDWLGCGNSDSKTFYIWYFAVIFCILHLAKSAVNCCRRFSQGVPPVAA